MANAQCQASSTSNMPGPHNSAVTSLRMLVLLTLPAAILAQKAPGLSVGAVLNQLSRYDGTRVWVEGQWVVNSEHSFLKAAPRVAALKPGWVQGVCVRLAQGTTEGRPIRLFKQELLKRGAWSSYGVVRVRLPGRIRTRPEAADTQRAAGSAYGFCHLGNFPAELIAEEGQLIELK